MSDASSPADEPRNFDLIIIGSGSGNSLVTPDFDDWRIALVEENSTFGGTCLNVGCIPTKMFVYPAEVAEHAADAGRLGLQPALLKADWPAIRDRIFGRIDPISRSGKEYRRDGTPNVTLYEAHAEFTGPRTLSLSTGETITADRIVLATGSRPLVPPPIADCGVPYETSDTVMRIDDLPDRVVILGGGYIAAEFAHVFSALGSHVSVVSRSPLLGDHDREMIREFDAVVRDDWHLTTGMFPSSYEHDDEGIHVRMPDGSSIDGDLLLVAVGRKPNSDRLNLAAAGVEVRDDGRVVVDEFQRTTAEGVWALGDVSTPYPLKHVANHETRVVAHNLAHPDDLTKTDHRFVPSAVFTHPPIASVGMTEEEAVASGRRYVKYVQHFGGTAYGWAMEDTTSLCKVLADPETGQLLGAHIMGEQASTLIQPIIQAMSFGLSARDMPRGQYWIHPALTEVVENAVLNLPLD